MQYVEILNNITTPTELAGVINKSISTASRIMAGKIEPNMNDLSQMFKYYKTKLPRSAFE